MLDFDLDCQNCDTVLQRERGCQAKGTVPFYIDGKPYFRCPVKLVTPLSWEYVRAFTLYSKSILPNAKGWIEESEKFLSAMTLIGVELAKQEQAKVRRKRKK